ncbi:hypothetical protein GYMLUDRAFT_157156 [Collybiopsis luxurians FD-317 M1]|nr:hypothetical protein GYMLUDRAFT_157156 [Collybiopsis luxurians FD-317 M1]
MSNATAPALSPAIPFQLLPPSIALQLQIKSYIYAGSSGILVWDVLSNLTDDWYLFHLSKNRYALAAYVLSRIGAMTYVIGRTVFTTAPVGNCKLADTVLDCFFPIGVGGSCLLFFLRVRAVYMAQKYIVAFFAFLWVSVLASCLVVPFGTIGVNIQDTPYCATVATRDFAIATVIVPTVYDTLVFSAISYKLLTYGFAPHRSLRDRILGSNLPAFSKAMFRDGQKYYLVTVLSNIVTIAMWFARVNPEYTSIFIGPNMMLTNIMACYVYRHTVLGRIQDPVTTINAQVIPTEQNVLPLTTHPNLAQGRSRPSTAMDGIVVEMTSITHVDEVHKIKPKSSMLSL